jgi:hypothetical protein
MAEYRPRENGKLLQLNQGRRVAYVEFNRQDTNGGNYRGWVDWDNMTVHGPRKVGDVAFKPVQDPGYANVIAAPQPSADSNSLFQQVLSSLATMLWDERDNFPKYHQMNPHNLVLLSGSSIQRHDPQTLSWHLPAIPKSP